MEREQLRFLEKAPTAGLVDRAKGTRRHATVPLPRPLPRRNTVLACSQGRYGGATARVNEHEIPCPDRSFFHRQRSATAGRATFRIDRGDRAALQRARSKFPPTGPFRRLD